MFLKFKTFVISFLLLQSVACGQNTIVNLFEKPSANARTAAINPQKGEKRVAQLRLNTEALSKTLSGESKTVNLNLYDNISVEVSFEKAEVSTYKGLTVIRGRSIKNKFTHLKHYRDVVMIQNPVTGKVVIQLNNELGNFEVKPIGDNGDYKITQWAEEASICEKDQPTTNALMAEATSGCEEKDASGKYVADLFVGYSYDAAAIAGDIDAHALSLVEMVNNGLTNSLVDNIYIRLVGTGISPQNPGVVTSVLGDVYTWFADEIALTAPDFVASVQVPTGAPNEAGGWASVGGYSSVNSIYNSAGVFRHEIGHNIGSQHCTPGILPYASGYNNGNVKTHLCGNNVNFYSTPLVNDNLGLPLGDAATADNGRVWKERAARVTANRKHSIRYDSQDVGCTTDIVNGTYQIQNVNSGKFIATQNAASTNSTKLVLADSSTNSQWNLYHLGSGVFEIEMVQNKDKSIDVPGNSSVLGKQLTIYSANQSSAQRFTFKPLSNNNYSILTSRAYCFQVENDSTQNGSFIVQNNCANGISGVWKLIPVNSNILNLTVTTTDVECFGTNTGSATALVTGGLGTYSYTWSNGATGTTVTNLAPGTYTLNVNDGSSSISYSFTIKQKDKFALNISTENSGFTPSGTATATVTGGQAPYTFTWSAGVAANASVSQLPTGLHTLTVSDQANCSYVKEFYIACTDIGKFCDDGDDNTIGDYIDKDCNCVGTPVVCTFPRENVALKKVATQASTHSTAVPSRAVDGNKDGKYNNGSVAHTSGSAVQDWWQVDLGQELKISDAVIWNRTDCCKDRLDSIYVFISTSPFSSNDITTTLADPNVWNIKLNSRKDPNIVISPNIDGRYFRIQNARKTATPLNIAEVEVFSCGAPIVSAITANPINGTTWELKGKIKKLGSTITEAYLEHGSGNFNNLEPISLANINLKDSLFLYKNIDITSNTSYQFRYKVVSTAGTYYSNEITFAPSSTYCSTTIQAPVWWKTFDRANYKGVEQTVITYYQDKTNTLLDSLSVDSTYSIDLRTAWSGWYNLTYKIYIDLNQDSLFSGYNELVGESKPLGHWTTVSFKIPKTDLKTGVPLRMRIQGYEDTYLSACESIVGNFADYKVVIKDAPCQAGGHITTLFRDQDGDGFGDQAQSILGNCATSPGYVQNEADINDTDASIYPDAPEICDGKDNNGNGQVDENGIPSVVNLNLNNQTIDPHTYRAAEKLTAANQVIVPNGNTVNFYAQKSVELLPGTTIEKGAVFKANIKIGCEN